MEEQKDQDMDQEEERQISIALCGFLEVAIHQILYAKHVYPRSSFKKAVRRNVPVWICRNNDVRKYIINFLDFAHGFLVQQHKIRVFFILKKSDTDDVVEQFVFECMVKDYLIRNNNQMIDIVDELITVCAAINKDNDLEKIANERFVEEFTFELQVRIQPTNAIIPRTSPSYPFGVYENKEKDTWDKILPLRAETNNLYELNAYACEQPREKRPPMENYIIL